MSSRPVVVVAASGLAREVMTALHAAGLPSPVAVLDDDRLRRGGELNGVPIVGGIETVDRYPESDLLICAGSGLARRDIAGRLRRMGVASHRFATVVHPTVVVPAGCAIGPGSILLAQVVLTAHVTIGSHVVAMPHAVFTHDDWVDDYATVCAGVALGGNVHIGQAAYLGMNSSVRQGVSVGQEAVLGMGAALLSDLPDRETWVGVPAAALDRGQLPMRRPTVNRTA